MAERIAAVYALMPTALDEAEIESQHALRITFKRLRYAVEVFAPCYGDAFDDLHATLTAFQDELGDMHDLHIFLDMVREPERRASAEAAGVSAEDISAVEALLEKKAHKTFLAFEKLAQDHQAAELLPALLLPLAQVPEPTPAADTSAVIDAEAPQALAVVGEVEPPPIEIPIADFGGYAIDPPIVVGATPWETPRVSAAGDPAIVDGEATAAIDAPAVQPAVTAAPEAPAADAAAQALPAGSATAPAPEPAPQTADPAQPPAAAPEDAVS